MNQTLALMMDAYRELNAKKLFWISLVLSGLIVVAVGAIGLDRDGLSIFGFGINLPIFEDGMLELMTDEQLKEARSEMYQGVFNFVGIQIWLTWAAIILAIFSTAGIFPDLMSSGAIDTLLTKPISRLRLFLTKYFLGLGFVGLQVAAFSIGAFFVVGVRAGDWELKLFWAIPIVLLFFSYLYAVSVLVGVLTRSTLLAVILTGLVWVVMIGLNFTDSILLAQQAQSAVDAEIAEKRIAYMKTLPSAEEAEATERAEALPEEPAEEPPGDTPADEDAWGDLPTEPSKETVDDFDTFDRYGDVSTREGYEQTWGDEASLQMQADSAQRMADELNKWRGYAFWVKTPLPKTSETADLMSMALLDEEDLSDIEFDPGASIEDYYSGGPFGGEGSYMQLVQVKTIQLQREQRGWAWVVLTSILFEVVVVGLAAWRFCRRDY